MLPERWDHLVIMLIMMVLLDIITSGTLTIPTSCIRPVPGSIEAAITAMGFWRASSTSMGLEATPAPPSVRASSSHRENIGMLLVKYKIFKHENKGFALILYCIIII